jgi:hypothetical protein
VNGESIIITVGGVRHERRRDAETSWRLDIDYAAGDGFRVIQFTPPGSACSVIFGKNVAAGAPGSANGVHLIVSDIQAACDKLLCRGVAISEPSHDAGGVLHHAGAESRLGGPNLRRKSYASFSDPDGNAWVLQEVPARLTGHIEAGDTSFTTELTNAVRHAAAATVST